MKKHLTIVLALLVCAYAAPSLTFLTPIAHADAVIDTVVDCTVLDENGNNPCADTTGTGGSNTTVNPSTGSGHSNFIPLTTIPGLTDSATLNNGDTVTTFLNNLYKFLIGLGAAVAVIEIIWGGLEIATQDSIGKHADGRTRIQQAILGLVLLLSPVIVFTIINPNILALSYTLAPLDIHTIPGQTPGNGPPVAATTAGCSAVSGPAAGTKLTTCKAADSAGAQREAQDFITNECSGADKKGATFPATCTNHTTQVVQNASGGSVSTPCSEYTAVAYCSPVITANIVENVETSPQGDFGGVSYTYIDRAYFAGTAFANSCKGNWSLVRTGNQVVSFGVTSNVPLGTHIDCPASDPAYQAIIQKLSGTFECVSVPVYCQYRP